MFDYMIVGAGFAGSVLAERLATQLDASVLIVTGATTSAGNAYDFYNDAGILVHSTGRISFTPTPKRVFDYLPASPRGAL